MFRDTDGGAGQGKVWSMSGNEKGTPGAFAYERASPPAPQGGGGVRGPMVLPLAGFLPFPEVCHSM